MGQFYEIFSINRKHALCLINHFILVIKPTVFVIVEVYGRGMNAALGKSILDIMQNTAFSQRMIELGIHVFMFQFESSASV